jgi:hypothetical protein
MGEGLCTTPTNRTALTVNHSARGNKTLGNFKSDNRPADRAGGERTKMRYKKLVVAFGTILLLAMARGSGLAQNPCNGQNITTANHFNYSTASPSAWTFSGSGGSPVIATFTVTAPSGGDVFPDCNTPDTANMFVQDVTQIADGSGNPLLDAYGNPTTIDITDTNAVLAAVIAGAFSFNPSSNIFNVGDILTVTVTISNPNSTAYGDYDIKMAAKETNPTSDGIGVGAGSHFILRLRGASCTDTTPPTVTVTKPNGDQLLGVTGVTVTAIDPDTPPGCGTGVVSMSASLSSAGGAVSNQAITLTPSPGLPVVAGVLVTSPGSITPVGGTGTAGTVNGSPFTSGSLSGIGNYTITAHATDGAGNIGAGTDNFNVTYDVTITNIRVSGSATPCDTSGGPLCVADFRFLVNRSNSTSDGAFMFDETVVVKLKNTGTNTYVATHSYGCTDPLTEVEIKTTTGAACAPAAATNFYATGFRRDHIGASGPATYVAEIYFLNVDNTLSLQATSSSVTF